MPYWEQTNLDEAISAILAEKEMVEQIAATGVPPDLVAGRVDRDRIREQAAQAAAAVDSLEGRRAAADEAAKAAVRRRIAWNALVIGAAVVAFAAWFAWQVGTAGFAAALSSVPQSIGSWVGLLFALALAAGAAERIQERFDRRRLRLARQQLGIDGLTTDIEEARRKANEDVQREIRAQVRLEISGLLAPSYETELPRIYAPGLSEVFNPRFEIATEAKDKLKRLLESMPGGSIGIAGPRGVGKTTLMSAFCGGAIQHLKGRRVLAVMIPAPVNYDAREFILHLFTKVCRQLRMLEGLEDHDSLESVFSLDAMLADAGRWRLSGAAYASGVAGAALIAIAVFLAWTGLAAGLDPQLVQTRAFLLALGLSPAPLLVSGLALAAASAVVLVRSRRPAGQTAAPPEASKLATDAEKKLRSLRFQQSFSSGWSGSLTLPVVEGGVNRAVQLAQTQLSIPEIVDQFRKFIRDAAAGKGAEKYQVIIGIDELDKIGSDEKAHQFLNDIKAVFGLEDCFYLISVSESAMSSFERRGLPFRDAFDSAFDGVVAVDYLSLERSQELLRRRVIGLPEPFIALCHCMSGGLPRDLIRVCRELVGSAALVEPPVSLADACRAVAGTDLAGKIKAVVAVAQRLSDEAKLKFVEGVRPFEIELMNVHTLLSWSADLWSAGTIEARMDEGRHVERALIDAQLAVTRLQLELSTYAYYLATLLEIFSRMTKSDMQSAKNGQFDSLARARQAFEIDPAVARSRINSARQQFALAAIGGATADLGKLRRL